ncbi:hypothetical protein KY290_030672 [Solanum tuberosum]|uniref:Retrotransposon gag domain-containing protein n=1 Tax=Solanum tuberosum TaxID=4113 RepID=A0ABQ7U7X7_SOLTU|nr:hypothetical protein KY290_030672 [Solanum tuberosum]
MGSRSDLKHEIPDVGRGFTFPPPPIFSSPPIFMNPAHSTTSPLLSTPVVHVLEPTNNQRTLKPKINFPEFEVENPRSWLRKYEKFFELYNILEQDKLSYPSVDLGERRFCTEVCRRFGNIRPQNIIHEFNKLMQVGTVDQYQDKFKELASYMTIINPLLNVTQYVGSFISGFRSELKPLVKLANPSTMLDAYEVAKLYEESFKALIPFVSARPPQTTTTRPLAITYPQNPQVTNSKPNVTPQQPLKITYPNQKPLQTRAPFKPNTLPPNLEVLREQGLCYRCKERYFPGHQCKQRGLHAIEGVEVEPEKEQPEEFVDVPETLEEEVEEQAEVSLNVLLGLSTTSGRISTIKIIGQSSLAVDPLILLLILTLSNC